MTCKQTSAAINLMNAIPMSRVCSAKYTGLAGLFLLRDNTVIWIDYVEPRRNMHPTDRVIWMSQLGNVPCPKESGPCKFRNVTKIKMYYDGNGAACEAMPELPGWQALRTSTRRHKRPQVECGFCKSFCWSCQDLVAYGCNAVQTQNRKHSSL